MNSLPTFQAFANFVKNAPRVIEDLLQKAHITVGTTLFCHLIYYFSEQSLDDALTISFEEEPAPNSDLAQVHDPDSLAGLARRLHQEFRQMKLRDQSLFHYPEELDYAITHWETEITCCFSLDGEIYCWLPKKKQIAFLCEDNEDLYDAMLRRLADLGQDFSSRQVLDLWLKNHPVLGKELTCIKEFI
jgi:hypothetical protein